MITFEQARYPTGRFKGEKSYSIEATRKNIKTIAKHPNSLRKLIKKLSKKQLEKSYREDGWTVRQIVNHLVDSHMNAYIRMKLAVTEPAPIIKPYEEALWAETEDGKFGSVKSALNLLEALHERWIDFMTSLSEEDLERGFFHPGTSADYLTSGNNCFVCLALQPPPRTNKTGRRRLVC